MSVASVCHGVLRHVLGARRQPRALAGLCHREDTELLGVGMGKDARADELPQLGRRDGFDLDGLALKRLGPRVRTLEPWH